MSGIHSAHVFTTLQQLLDHCVGPEEEYKELGIYTGSGIYKLNIKHWTRCWNKHVEKHGNVPYIIKYSLCSGNEFKNDRFRLWKNRS